MNSNRTVSRILGDISPMEKRKTVPNKVKVSKYSAIKTNLCAGIRAILSIPKKTSITSISKNIELPSPGPGDLFCERLRKRNETRLDDCFSWTTYLLSKFFVLHVKQEEWWLWTISFNGGMKHMRCWCDEHIVKIIYVSKQWITGWSWYTIFITVLI